MPIPDPDEIRAFLHDQLELWNAGDRQAHAALYRRYAERELVIEYVGQPVGDGWATFDHMWDNFGGKIRVEAALMLVNGNEGACHHLNIRRGSGLTNPTIETYRFEDGGLYIRYFYAPQPVE